MSRAQNFTTTPRHLTRLRGSSIGRGVRVSAAEWGGGTRAVLAG